MHIPDGVLPVWLVVLGWLLTGGFLALATWRLKRGDAARQLPLLGVMAAVMLVGMSVEFVPIAYHTNLSVLAGIVLGPSLGFLAALIVNLILALFGHGGITVVGLNALVVGAEAFLGFYFFRGAWSLLKRSGRSPALAAGLATVATLILSTLLMIGIVGLSNLDPGSRVGSILGGLSFKNPLEHGLVGAELPGSGEAHAGVAGLATGGMDVATFARMVILLGSLGWLLESVLTGAIVGFVYRVRPDLVVGRGAATSSARRLRAAPSGPEGGDGAEQPPLERAG